MSFGSPLFLLGLLAVPLLIGGYLLAQRRRQIYAVRFTNLRLLAQVVPHRPAWRRHLPVAVFLVALTGLLVSFARPAIALSVPRDRASVMLAIDVSGSMAAKDVEPTRLDAARQAARSLVDSLPDRAEVGLISFSSSAELLAPLSSDRTSLLAALESIHPGGSTAIGDAVNLAVDQLSTQQPDQSGKRPPSMIVLLTDGGNNVGSDPVAAATRAGQAGIPVQTVGVGTRGGSVIFAGQDIGGVDEGLLRQIAADTGAQYHFAGETGQLQQIYSSLGNRFGFRTEHVDLTVPVVGGATLALLLAGLLSLRWFRLLP